MTITTKVEDLVKAIYGSDLSDLEARVPEGYYLTGEFREAQIDEPHLPTENAVGLRPDGKMRFGFAMPRLILRRKAGPNV